jgi:hypothetical protein
MRSIGVGGIELARKGEMRKNEEGDVIVELSG